MTSEPDADLGAEPTALAAPASRPARRPGRRLLSYAAVWLLAAGLSVAVGLFAVTAVGANLRGRGPLGDGLGAESVEGRAVADPDARVVRDELADEYGTFVVECQGVVARGLSADPAPGWRVVSYEEGPDDDVDAIFSSGRRSVELEVYCNNGRPRLAEQETKTLPSSRG